MRTETLTRAQEFPEKQVPSSVFFHPHLSQRAGRAGLVMPTAAKLRGCLRLDEPMARHVSWRAGGSVTRSYQPADLSDLQAFLRTLPETEPIYFVGLGSNLLVRDGGLRGTVVFTHWALRELGFREAGKELYAEAGLPSPKVARFAALHGCAGAEFLAGIPGTVGGALAMNAGCYGAETWGIVVRVRTVDRRGQVHERTPADFNIEYRHVTLKRRGDEDVDAPAHLSSVTPHPSEEWFVSATFRLTSGDVEVSRHKIQELLKRRIATQPLSEPNAGSVFRNPVGDFAARLIEACGLKGHTIGGAVFSPKHANFIINRGDARAADIEALIECAQSAVKAKFGIELEREVKIIGERGA
jgi:UDP-N-acetylmuramate dehydrogenase